MENLKTYKSATRSVRIENGLNDLRFVSRAIPDKKKESNKKSCRGLKVFKSE